MFKTLFLATLLVTLLVNIFFLFATEDKPPDLRTSTYISVLEDNEPESSRISSSQRRRLFLRSNEFYDYSSFQAKFDSPRVVASEDPFWIETNRSKPLVKGTKVRVSQKEEDKEELHDNQFETHNSIGLKQAKSKLQNEKSFNQDKNNKNRKDIKLLEYFSWSLGRQSSGESNGKSKSKSKSQSFAQSSNYYQQPQHTTNSPSVSPGLPQADNGFNPSAHDDYYFSAIKSLETESASFSPIPTTISSTSSSSGTNSKVTVNITVSSSKNRVSISLDNHLIYNSQSYDLNAVEYQARNQADKQGKAISDSKKLSISRLDGEVKQKLDSLSNTRGIHVLVLNQFDGSIMSQRIFDTYSPQQEDHLCLFVSLIRDGRIIIFAILDEASFQMPANSRARQLLQKLGSRHIMKLGWRDMWAMVVRKSTTVSSSQRLDESRRQHFEEAAEKHNLAEGLSKSSSFSDWAPAVVIQAKVELLDNSLDKKCDSWLKEEKEEDLKRREEFCNRLEGYGRVCDCQEPAPISFETSKIENSQLNQVPIIVIASNRPYYLYRMLRSLLEAQGVDKRQIIIFVDGFYQEPLMVGRLFDLRVIQKKPLGSRSARISHHYKSSLSETFELFPNAKFAIIFEEDLDVASDTLIYFNKTMGLLERDPSLYCISAWNDQGYEHSVGTDGSLMYRIETMPGLGWMLSRELYKNELELNWPSHEFQHDWDMWIRTEKVRRNRECIIPDISRTFHFGSIGTNINSYFQRQYFEKHAFASKFISQTSNLLSKEFELKVEQLEAIKYEETIENLIKQGQVLQNNNKSLSSLEFLCSLGQQHEINSNNQQSNSSDDTLQEQLTSKYDDHDDKLLNQENKSKQAKTNVIFIDMIDNEDFASWLKLAKCWQIWDLDARGQHKSMWRLFLNNLHTLVIGFPASPYSRFKPSDIQPFGLR